jgi:hypothetical protein
VKRGQLVAALLLAVLAGCQMNVTRGSGTVTSETRPVSGVTGVRLEWLGDVTITQGDTEALTVEAEDNILPLITTNVENGTLVIALKPDTNRDAVIPTKPVRFGLDVTALELIDISGAGNVRTDGLEGETLALNLSGAGNVDLSGLQLIQLTASSSGAGNISLAGVAEDQSSTLSGLGNYQAGDLESIDARVEISGAGNATVWVRNQLDVKISGAGSVSYYGEPQVTQDVSGVGSVKPLGEK